MTLVIRHTSLTDPADKSEVEENFADVVNYINGNIEDSNIKSGAGIAIGKLSAKLQEVWLQLHWDALRYTGVWPAAPADPTAPTKDELLDYVSLPGSDGDTEWLVTDVSASCNDTGTAAATFDVRYGAYSAGTVAGAGTIVTGATITQVGADLGADVRALEDGSVSIVQSATVRGIYLVSASQGTAVMDDTGGANTNPSWLKVTVAMRRNIF